MLNQLPDLGIIPLDNDCVVSNVFSSTDDLVKRRLQEMHRLLELHVVKYKTKKEGGDFAISDIKNLRKTLSSKILKKEKYAMNKIEIKDNSRYVSTVVLNTIAHSSSLNVQSSKLQEFHHNCHYSHNISNESGNKNKTTDQYQELKNYTRQSSIAKCLKVKEI